MTEQQTESPIRTVGLVQPEPGAIYSQMVHLMAAVKDIPKTREASFGGERGPKTKFRGIEETVQKVGEAAREAQIMLQASVVGQPGYHTEQVPKFYNGKQTGTTTWTSARVVMRFCFTSLVDGSVVVFEAPGEGKDSSDKATAKAMSNALKYALGQALLIGTGDADPDDDYPVAEQGTNTPPGQSTAEQAAQRQERAAYEGSTAQDAGQARERQQQAGEPPAGNPADRALQALRAARGASNMEVFGSVWNQATSEKLMDVTPTGEQAPLKPLLMAARATIPRGDQ